MRRLFVVAVALFIVSACLPAELSQGPGIIGTYVVNGVDPNGTEYTGRLSISPGGGDDEVVVEWVVTGAILHGDGVVDGNVLTVDWSTSEGPRGVSHGTAEYEILPDGRLVGTRTVDGVDQPGSEEIFPDP